MCVLVMAESGALVVVVVVVVAVGVGRGGVVCRGTGFLERS
jgi:hypothetical protein